MAVKELVIETLSEFGYPVLLQGSLSKDEEYPESFFTFWNNNSFDGSHFDNESISAIWDFDVNFYSKDPVLVNSKLLEAKNALKNQGFIVSGQGYDVASDEVSRTGRGIQVLKIEKLEYMGGN